ERRSEIRDNILETVAEFIGRQVDTLESLANELEPIGISIVRGASPGDPAFQIGKQVFEEKILPTLAVPEPFTASSLNNLENMQTAVVFRGDRWSVLPK